jgi:YD repeat-containing protein
MGRINLQYQVNGTTTRSLSYAYNLAGLLTSETYPSGRVVSYAYDAAARACRR